MNNTDNQLNAKTNVSGDPITPPDYNSSQNETSLNDTNSTDVNNTDSGVDEESSKP
jgi:hypothetical protein